MLDMGENTDTMFIYQYINSTPLSSNQYITPRPIPFPNPSVSKQVEHNFPHHLTPTTPNSSISPPSFPVLHFHHPVSVSQISPDRVVERIIWSDKICRHPSSSRGGRRRRNIPRCADGCLSRRWGS